MTLTSLKFMLFLLGGTVIYYLVPKKIQWITLLCLSLVYYCLAATPYTLVFLIFSTVLAYISSNSLEWTWVSKREYAGKIITALTVFAIVVNILIWLFLKGFSFVQAGGYVIRLFIHSFPQIKEMPVVAALGMGYYTAQIIGYILDCYWGICKPEKNILKLFLFVCFFPQLTVGPISKKQQLDCVFEEHFLKYQNIAFGVQRILWGLFKKLVISDRIAKLVNYIWADTLQYNGIWIWIAVLLYPLEIYTDFSGCMDIVLGAAELFDVHLPENFRNPFFSRNCQEFWQRWHITLGIWAKDHVYYPVLKSRPVLDLGKRARSRFGKRRISKLIPWAAGMGVLWFVMGFWHGSMRHILGVSAYFWIILVAGETISPLSEKMIYLMKIDVESFSWKLFQCIRTYIIYSVGDIFFSANDLWGAFDHFKVFIKSFSPQNWNPWVLVDGSILNTPVTHRDINIIIVGLIALLLVDILREKYRYARIWIAEQILPFRWVLYVTLFLAVIIFGMYGPSFDASSFIYGQF